MTVIRPNSISGITSITTLQNSIEFFKSDGSAGSNINNISINSPSGIITAAHFYGNGSNLTGITGTTINDNAVNRIITGSNTANTLNGESLLTFSSGSGILSLTGDFHVSGEVAIAENIVHTGDGNTTIGFPANDTIAFTTGGGERLRIDSSGNAILKATNAAFKSESSSSGDYVRMYAAGGTGKWDIYGNGANLRFSDNDSAGNIQMDRPLSLPASNIVMGSGYGIDFSAKTVVGDQGTASASVLDDFEEGSWTCTLTGSSGGSITAVRACYTKVGNMVMCEASFINPGNNSVSGNWSMSLPFQFIGAGSGAYGGGYVTYSRYVPALTSGFQSYTLFTYHGQGVVYLYKLGTNGSSESQWTGGSVNNNLLFSFTMTYTTGT